MPLFGWFWVCYLWFLGLLSCCDFGVGFCCFGLAWVLFALVRWGGFGCLVIWCCLITCLLPCVVVNSAVLILSK